MILERAWADGWQFAQRWISRALTADRLAGDRQLFSASLSCIITLVMHTSVYIQAPGCLIKIRNWEFVDGPPCSFFSSAESFPDGWAPAHCLFIGRRETCNYGRRSEWARGDSRPLLSTQHSKLASALLCCAPHQNLWPLCLIEITVGDD